ncbi:MAG TPA: PrsW family glutamic-type intramembrane protease [Ktedonobacteraceae bacterium]|nr:PrsW family glutamic-type intramembrane protease [Ktedonobacteraceae bacterium]
MGSEYMGPNYGPQSQAGQSLYAPTRGKLDEDTQPRQPTVPVPSYGYKQNNNNGYQEPANTAGEQNNTNSYQEPVYREHVSGTYYMHPSDAPHFRQAYPAYPAPPNGLPQGQYPGYPQPHPGYMQPYPGYMPPYPWPPKPKRDGYLFGVSITAFTCTILVTLGGLACLLILTVFTTISARSPIKPDQSFAGTMEFIAFTLAGLLGGGFGLYHSIRALLQKASTDFKLPWFWLFLLFYGIVIALAESLRSVGLAITNMPLTALLIVLSGVLPALTATALALRRIHYPREIRWPTSWRRFTFSLVTGATLAVILALILEFILDAVTKRALHITDIQIDNPDAPMPTDLRDIGFLVVLVSVIAPLVEEAVKPLAVVVMIGRIRSAAEAFMLGMAGGIGFALIETTGYIGMGYKDWVDVALQRTSASLLHGLGAGMVALGWYYMTHSNSLKRHRIRIALGCWAYAIAQHAIWNGSGFLQALPGPVGQYLATGNITLGVLSFPSFMLVYVLETILMLIFLFYVTKRLRPKMPLPTKQPGTQTQMQAQSKPYYAHVG